VLDVLEPLASRIAGRRLKLLLLFSKMHQLTVQATHLATETAGGEEDEGQEEEHSTSQEAAPAAPGSATSLAPVNTSDLDTRPSLGLRVNDGNGADQPNTVGRSQMAALPQSSSAGPAAAAAAAAAAAVAVHPSSVSQLQSHPSASSAASTSPGDGGCSGVSSSSPSLKRALKKPFRGAQLLHSVLDLLPFGDDKTTPSSAPMRSGGDGEQEYDKRSETLEPLSLAAPAPPIGEHQRQSLQQHESSVASSASAPQERSNGFTAGALPGYNAAVSGCVVNGGSGTLPNQQQHQKPSPQPQQRQFQQPSPSAASMSAAASPARESPSPSIVPAASTPRTSARSAVASSSYARPGGATTARNKLTPISAEFPLKILLAEDNAVNQKMMVMLLRKLGYEILVAANGREALDLLEAEARKGRAHEISCILMDASMDVMDGMECTRVIRAQQLPHRVRPFIIAQTANVTDEYRRRCLDSGMDMFTCKPVDIQELVRCLKIASQQAREAGATTGAAAPGSGPAEEVKLASNRS